MTTGAPIMSQKEYLQKYLSNNKKKKKKVKISSSSLIKRSKIIDDDFDDLVIKGSVDDDEFNLDYMGDEAPQIAGIVDDRPLEMRTREQYSTSQWKDIGESADNSSSTRKTTLDSIKKEIFTDDRDHLKKKSSSKDEVKSMVKSNSDSDMSPPRITQSRRTDSPDPSAPRKLENYQKKKYESGSDLDISPPRRVETLSKKNSYYSKSSKKSVQRDSPKNVNKGSSDSDLSPPRKISGPKRKETDFSGIKNDRGWEKSRESSDSDMSLPRKLKNRQSDANFLRLPKQSDRNTGGHKNRELGHSGSSKRGDHKGGQKYRASSDSDASKRKPKEVDLSEYSYKDHRSNRSQKHRTSSDSDVTPPRKSSGQQMKQMYHSETSKKSGRSDPSRRSRREESDSDVSPPRRPQDVRRDPHGVSASRKKDVDSSDVSLARKSRSDISGRYDKNRGSPRSRVDDGNSSRRGRRQEESSSDPSPPMRQPSSSSTKGRTGTRSRDEERHRGRDCDDSDLSPPRRSTKCNEPRDVKKSSEKEMAKDLGSLQKHRDRRPVDEGDRKEDRRKKDSNFEGDRKRHRPNDSSPASPKLMEKTLDGKKAGLQHANSLKEELKQLKRKEDRMFKELAAASTGKEMAPIVRDRATGKKRDLERERLETMAKAAKQAETNEKYYKWGKGLKQIEDSEKRVSDAVREMSKPLARYATDEDLENYLKAQEREGDPMLDYIRQKQEESVDLSQPGRQKYKGSFMPNRFGIAPGFRWDGVDRSNGYEKQWFETRNAKKAVEEEAYKWSTSDM